MEIEYLANPCRKENQRSDFQMKWNADQIYPGFTRTIYLKGLRYNLHLRPRSALIESGTNNTYEEAVNAMDRWRSTWISADRLMARSFSQGFFYFRTCGVPEKWYIHFESGVIYYKR